MSDHDEHDHDHHDDGGKRTGDDQRDGRKHEEQPAAPPEHVPFGGDVHGTSTTEQVRPQGVPSLDPSAKPVPATLPPEHPQRQRPIDAPPQVLKPFPQNPTTTRPYSAPKNPPLFVPPTKRSTVNAKTKQFLMYAGALGLLLGVIALIGGWAWGVYPMVLFGGCGMALLISWRMK